MRKASSSDITNRPLIEQIASFGKPIILSTGASHIWEIEEALDWIRPYSVSVMLLHCILNYPTKDINANLGMIKDLSRRFPDNLIGYSDHTSHEITGALAFSQGAQIIEKHLTFSNELEGPDHQASLNPENFKTFISNIRYAQEVKGDKKKLLTKEEKEVRNVARKSLVFSKDLKKGTKITLNDIDAMRPASGLNINEINKVLNKIVLKNVKETELIKLKDLKD